MNRVTNHLGTKYPIIQAPMGWIARSQLASAVSNAGGLGVIETSSGEVEACKKEIQKMSTLTSNPFGVNLPILFLQDDSIVDFVAECGVKFVTTSAGSPAKYIDRLKSAGLIVYHAVPSLAGAMKAQEAGVDGLVVEGTEGGGFKNPEEIGLHVLIQAIRKKTDLPIIAAGGIADGVGMAAAFASGAEGVQMGTRFVSSKESPVHQNWKDAILTGSESDTYILNKSGSPCLRAIKTDYSKEIYEKGSMDMSVFKGVQDLYFGGDLNAAPALTGQSMGLIDEIKSVEEIINLTVKEFNRTLESLNNSKI